MLLLWVEMWETRRASPNPSHPGEYDLVRGGLFHCSLPLRREPGTQRELGDKWGIAASLNNLGGVAYEQGDFASSRSLHEESLALFRELGDKGNIAFLLVNLGVKALNQGDFASSRSLHEESLALFRELGDKGGIASCLHSLASVALSQGDFASARSLFEESLALSRELGHKVGISFAISALGGVALSQGEYATACALYLESLLMMRELGDQWGTAIGLAGVGEAAVERGQPQRGARLLGASDALYEAIGAVRTLEDRTLYDRAAVSARSQLGEEAFSKAMREGRTMSMEQAIEYALESESNE